MKFFDKNILAILLNKFPDDLTEEDISLYDKEIIRIVMESFTILDSLKDVTVSYEFDEEREYCMHLIKEEIILMDDIYESIDVLSKDKNFNEIFQELLLDYHRKSIQAALSFNPSVADDILEYLSELGDLVFKAYVNFVLTPENNISDLIDLLSEENQ